MRRLNSFRSKLNSDKVQKDSENWMNNKLVFHIDSARAYQTLDNKKKAETRDKIKKPEEDEDDLVTIDTRKGYSSIYHKYIYISESFTALLEIKKKY